jgi:hypothetical protein
VSDALKGVDVANIIMNLKTNQLINLLFQ